MLYSLYLPMYHNNGELIPQWVQDAIRKAILDIAGGYSESLVSGAYRMADGSVVTETIHRIDTISQDDLATQLRDIAKTAAKLCDQESILVTCHPVNSFFVIQ
jgi:hypothetical protein